METIEELMKKLAGQVSQTKAENETLKQSLREIRRYINDIIGLELMEVRVVEKGTETTMQEVELVTEPGCDGHCAPEECVCDPNERWARQLRELWDKHGLDGVLHITFEDMLKMPDEAIEELRGKNEIFKKFVDEGRAIARATYPEGTPIPSPETIPAEPKKVPKPNRGKTGKFYQPNGDMAKTMEWFRKEVEAHPDGVLMVDARVTGSNNGTIWKAVMALIRDQPNVYEYYQDLTREKRPKGIRKVQMFRQRYPDWCKGCRQFDPAKLDTENENALCLSCEGKIDSPPTNWLSIVQDHKRGKRGAKE